LEPWNPGTMRQWLIRYLLSPYTLASILAVIIIIFLPPAFHRYNFIIVGIVNESYKNPSSYLLFADLNGDGKGEKIDTYYEAGKRTAIQIYSPDDAIMDQWNFRGRFTEPRNRSVLIGNADGNGTKEIIVFTIIKDSLFISCIDRFDGSFHFKERFFTKISSEYYHEPSYSLTTEGLFNLSDDNSKTLIFNVSAARSLQPRKLFAFDYVKDTVYSSDSYGLVPSSIKQVDLNRDGDMELVGNTAASGNIPDSLGIPYHDYSAWLMVFNGSLDLLSEPKAFPGFRNDLMVLPVIIDGVPQLAALLIPVGVALDHPHVMLCDANGNVIKDQVLENLEPGSKFFMNNPFNSSESPSFLLIDQKGSLTELDHDFNCKEKVEISVKPAMGPVISDFDSDSEPELLLISEKGNEILIFENLSSSPTKYFLPPDFGLADFSVGFINNDLKVILVQGENYYQMLEYRNNPLYYLRWLVYIGIYLSLLLFIMLIRRLQQIQIDKNQAVRDQILQLQLKTIQNQMDPHFTFNVFNSIAHIIRNDERDYAFQSFLKFSGIVRATLLDSDKIVRKLEDEIRFVENYLALEKLRYKGRIEHEIRVSPEVKMDTPVPKMILQIFVENAIKHGLRHRPEGGKLSMEIRKDDRYLVMIIEDNGVGREKAKELSKDSTGMGLMIMERYISLFNQFNRQQIRYEILDLYSIDGKASGTRVSIMI
jgi:hypothetical protein